MTLVFGDASSWWVASVSPVGMVGTAAEGDVVVEEGCDDEEEEELLAAGVVVMEVLEALPRLMVFFPFLLSQKKERESTFYQMMITEREKTRQAEKGDFFPEEF